MMYDGVLPAGWVYSNIESVCSKVTDGTHHSPSQEFQTPDGEFKYITAKNIKEWGLDLSELTYLPEAIHRPIYARCNPEVGDVLYIKDGVTTGVATVNPLAEEFSLLSSVALLKPRRDIIDPYYLKWYLNSPIGFRSMKAQMTGTAIRRLILKRIKKGRVPLAPLDQQKRIVAKIEELLSDLDAGVAALKRAQANLKRYRAAVLKAAVEGKLTEQWRAENPPSEPASALLQRILAERRKRWEEEQLKKYEAKGKKPPSGWKDKYKEPSPSDRSGLPPLPVGWTWTNLAQLKSWAMYGPRFSSGLYTNKGVLVLRTSDFTDYGGIDFRTPPRMNLSDEDFSKYHVEQHDLLITRTGSLGTLAVFPGGAQAIAGAFLIHYRLAAPPTTVRYLFHFLKSPSGQRQLLAGGRGVGRPNLNMPTIDSIPIPLPPSDEQLRIVETVDEHLSIADAAIASAGAALGRAELLRQAILRRAFSGGLTPVEGQSDNSRDDSINRNADRQQRSLRAEHVERSLEVF